MPTDVETLMEMGFSENRAQRALAATRYKSVQVAMDWLFAHSDDPDIDEPFQVPEGHKLRADTSQGTDEGGDSKPGEEEVPMEEGATLQAKSLKCDECGKKLRRPEDVQVHAARTGHENFSESTEEIKPLTAEEKQEQMLRLQEKMKQRQKEKAELAKKEAIDREKLRRKQGKELVEAKQKREMDEVRKLAEQKKREKQEERLARQKVREEIERDKRERAARFAKTSPEAAQPKPATQPTAPPAAAAAAAAAPKKEYDSTRLQIRLPDGSALTNSFSISEQLAAVRLFVELNRKDGSNAPFSFMTTFPKKLFTEEDMEKPLKELGLVPSAVLMVTKLAS